MTKEESTYNKIRNLLKKAESTNFPAEAQALFAKAQELMIKYAIEEADLDASDPSRRTQSFVLRVQKMPSRDDYWPALWNAIAKANNCKGYRSLSDNSLKVAGYESDVDFVEMMYSSISTQMHLAFLFEDAPKGMHRKTFKHNFYTGYAYEIKARLEQASENTVQEYGSKALALRDRIEQATDWLQGEHGIRFVQAKSLSRFRADLGSQHMGRMAAQKADLNSGRNTVQRGSTKELGK